MEREREKARRLGIGCMLKWHVTISKLPEWILWRHMDPSWGLVGPSPRMWTPGGLRALGILELKGLLRAPNHHQPCTLQGLLSMPITPLKLTCILKPPPPNHGGHGFDQAWTNSVMTRVFVLSAKSEEERVFEMSSSGRGEPAVRYRWTSWVWERTGWSSRPHANYRSF